MGTNEQHGPNPATKPDTTADIATYLAASVGDDISLLPEALGAISRTQGMSKLSRKTGLTRETLYRALKPGGNPTLYTIRKVLDAYGLHITLVPKD
jgi:probable addiction module antidote protein